MCAPQYEYTTFVTMAMYWLPDLPDIQSFACCIWCPVLIFTNGASSKWSSKHNYINMLCEFVAMLNVFLSLKSPKPMKSGWGDWKRASCHRNQIFYNHSCAACRTNSIPLFNGLCCKLTEIALFIYLRLNDVISLLICIFYTYF